MIVNVMEKLLLQSFRFTRFVAFRYWDFFLLVPDAYIQISIPPQTHHSSIHFSKLNNKKYFNEKKTTFFSIYFYIFRPFYSLTNFFITLLLCLADFKCGTIQFRRFITSMLRSVPHSYTKRFLLLVVVTWEGENGSHQEIEKIEYCACSGWIG